VLADWGVDSARTSQERGDVDLCECRWLPIEKLGKVMPHSDMTGLSRNNVVVHEPGVDSVDRGIGRAIEARPRSV